MNKPLILVVEDDIPVRNLITITLKTHGYRYLTAGKLLPTIRMWSFWIWDCRIWTA